MQENQIVKAKYWQAVLYPENMKEGWESEVGDTVQYPYAYCLHTQDRDSTSEHRKDHVHMIIACPNTTTYNHAMSVFNLLSAPGKKALNKIEACISIRRCYDYLIHDTDDSRKKGKERYDPSERITGNNFDIGSYEQLDVAEKNAIFIELSNAIKENGIFNYMDFWEYITDHYEDINYIEVMRCYSNHYQRLCDGNYQKWQQGRLKVKSGNIEAPSQAQQHASNTEEVPVCCPECGSINIKKNGKTAANSQRWVCKDCGKSFVEGS